LKKSQLFQPNVEIVENLWIDTDRVDPNSNILLTVSNSVMNKTFLISQGDITETKSSIYVQTPLERPVVGKNRWVARVGASGKLFGYVLVAILLSFSALSIGGVMKARIVLTGSMAPTINSGDIILTASPARLTPKKGDVVAYTGRRFDGSSVGIFSHRIIGGDSQTGFIVKGDHNPSPDVQHPKIADIDGVVFFTIPFIGKFLTLRSLIVLVPIIVGLWLVFGALKSES